MDRTKIKDILASLAIIGSGFLILLLIDTCMCIFLQGYESSVFYTNFTLDAYWYKSIIDHGYMKYSVGDPLNEIKVVGGKNGMANWAFFPLLPFIIKILRTITFNLISIEMLSFIFSFLCYVGFIYNLIRYLKEKNIKINYILIFFVFVFSPLMMYFYSLYTEPLTMLLIIVLIRKCDEKKFFVGGLLCALLTAIKVQGCFWCIYLFIKIYQELSVKDKNIFLSFFKTIGEIFKNPMCLLSLCISPLGLFAFLAILNASGLSVLSFIHVQSGWGKENNFFLVTIFKGILGETLQIESFAAIIFLIFSVYLVIKKKYLSFTMLMFYIVSSCTSSVNSVTRYVLGSVIFPLELYLLLIQIRENKGKYKIRGEVFYQLFYLYKIVFVGTILILFYQDNYIIFY